MQLNILKPTIISAQHLVEKNNYFIQQAEQQYIHIKARREKIFFTPVINHCVHKEVTTEVNNHINQNFYDKINIATDLKLVEMLTNLIQQLKLADNYYCNGNYSDNLNHLISEIARKPKNAKIVSQLRNICYWLYSLVNILQNFQYQHEYLSETITINKEAIALRLQESLVNLSACWDGIASRFAHEYEILNAIQQGLAGKIFLIRKGLFKKLTSQFIYNLKQEKNYDVPASMEIHLYNLLRDTTAQQLGFINITDSSLPEEFPADFVKEFKELATIDISPANISRILAEQLYENLVDCLKKNNQQDWLYKPKQATYFNAGLNRLLESAVFAPANILFNPIAEQQLSINTITDYTEQKNGELLYSISNSPEKLHFWVANNLMPNTEKILIANIYNQQTQSYVNIASIDYMFFWVIEQDKYQDNFATCSFNTDNYITLDLSYIQQLDFIEFTDANINEHPDLFNRCTKTAVSIALVSQALSQTNNPMVIMHFFTNNRVKNHLEKSPLLNKKIHAILKNKLIDNRFREYFINEMNNYYANHLITKITKNEASFFIQHKMFDDIFPQIIKQHIDIHECFELSNDKVLVVLQKIKKLSSSEIKTIFRYAKNNNQLLSLLIDTNSAKLIYLLFISNNKRLDLINDNYNAVLSVAISNGHSDLIKFLLKFNPIKINNHVLHDVICYADYTTYKFFKKHIIKNIKSFDTKQLLELLQAKNSGGIPAIVIALKNKKYKLIADYFKFIVSIKQLNETEKLFLFKAISNGTLLSYAHNNCLKEEDIAAYIENYINIILNIPEINSTQAVEIIESKNNEGNSILYLEMQQGHHFAIVPYIRSIIDSSTLTVEEKFNIILAQGSEGSGLSLLIQNNSYETIDFYKSSVIQKKIFNAKQIFKLLQAKGINDNNGLYTIINNAIKYNSFTDQNLYNSFEMLDLYISLILENNILSSKQKVELLLAKNSSNITALYLALPKNKYIYLQYIEYILITPCLTTEQKFELILAQGKRNINIIHAAIENNNLIILSQILLSILNMIREPGFFPLCRSKYQIINSYDCARYHCAEVLDKCISFILNTDMFNIKQKQQICNFVRDYKNYTRVIKRSKLSTTDKNKLLSSI